MTAELAGQAVIIAAILASTMWSEWRGRRALRSIRAELAAIKQSIVELTARMSALESKRNGGDALTVDAASHDSLMRHD